MNRSIVGLPSISCMCTVADFAENTFSFFMTALLLATVAWFSQMTELSPEGFLGCYNSGPHTILILRKAWASSLCYLKTETSGVDLFLLTSFLQVRIFQNVLYAIYSPENATSEIVPQIKQFWQRGRSGSPQDC